ncbi:MAG: DNA polymerase IV [Actinomycetota bacterium]|nr:DNA polymerase IV [Actinomycetota bacterium]
MATFVFHVDLDQFLAAVEVLRHPELRGRPVIVGGDGDPTKRGVVSTSSYEARAFGVRSGMPLRTALKRCPDAVFLPVDAPTYLEMSRRVMDALRSFGFVVQEMGWDEAFIAVETDHPECLAREIQRRILERTELWCSIGIGDNKLQAKIATEEGKPAGVFILTSDRWPALMGPRATDALWGIGTKTARKLAAIGIGTVDELATADRDEVAAAFGPSTGPWLVQLARGEDPSPVSDAPWIPRGVSRERTFQQDLATQEEIFRELDRLASETTEDVRKEGRHAVRVVVKLRLVPFITKTRGISLPEPTSEPEAIAAGARAAFARFPTVERPVRLLGVRAELEESGPSGPSGGLDLPLLDIPASDADD